MSSSGKYFSLIVALALGVGAVGVGAMLTSQSTSNTTGSSAGSTYILGPARSLLSATLYQRADTYFHKGAPPNQEEAFESIFQKWKEAINPTEHRHTTAAETLEIMPWLRLATKTDPHNIEPYLVACYWLNGDCGRPDLALGVIEEAVGKNPDRYEIYLEKGRLHLSNNQPDQAMNSFFTTLTLLNTVEQTDPEQALIDRSTLLTIQSLLFEAQGSRTEAIEATRQNLALYPDRSSHSNRLIKLENEPLNPEQAQQQLAVLFTSKYVCAAEANGEHVHSENCSHGAPVVEDAQDHVHGPSCNH
ncbi:MAG: hypothetical protein V3V05_02340 [Pontiella sp.]